MTDAEAAEITRKAFELFPDEETARSYLEGRLWPAGPVCPECSSKDRISTLRKDGYYRCNARHDVGQDNGGRKSGGRDRGRQVDFTVCTDTIFEGSHVPLDKWVCAMYLLVHAKDGISSKQLAKQIQVTQKSAWFMLHRLREALGSDEDTHQFRDQIKLGLSFKLKDEAQKLCRRCSKKHLTRYVDEFVFRHHMARPVEQQLERLVRLGAAGNRITYEELIA